MLIHLLGLLVVTINHGDSDSLSALQACNYCYSVVAVRVSSTVTLRSTVHSDPVVETLGWSSISGRLCLVVDHSDRLARPVKWSSEYFAVRVSHLDHAIHCQLLCVYTLWRCRYVDDTFFLSAFLLSHPASRQQLPQRNQLSQWVDDGVSLEHCWESGVCVKCLCEDQMRYITTWTAAFIDRRRPPPPVLSISFFIHAVD